MILNGWVKKMDQNSTGKTMGFSDKINGGFLYIFPLDQPIDMGKKSSRQYLSTSITNGTSSAWSDDEVDVSLAWRMMMGALQLQRDPSGNLTACYWKLP